jgi:radical SAM superfamily enzyme YgiQ (UPF0313 family)
MIQNLLFIQPPLVEEAEKHFENEILIWPVYIQNFLNKHYPKLKSDLLYLPLELKNGGFSLKSPDDIKNLYSKLDELTNTLDYNLSDNSMILISGTTNSYFLVSKIIAEYFHKYYNSSLILYGGAAASASADDFIYDGSPIDFQIQGEGELNLLNLLKQNPKKQNIPQVINNHPIPDLNELPMIDFAIFNKYIKNFNTLSINLSRGCPYSCEFCQEFRIFRNVKKIPRWRAYTPQRAIKEFGRMVNYGLMNNIVDFGLYDSVFALSADWLRKFLGGFSFQGIKSIWTETRIDILNKSLIKSMQNKHIFLWMGVEHFSPRILKLMNKTSNPKNYLNKIFDIFNIFNSLNYRFSINLIANYPGTTMKDESILYDTLDDLIDNGKIDPTNISLKKFHIFPGNSLYDSFTFNGENRFYIPQLKSIAYFPKWWKNKDTLENGLFCVRPSQKFSLRKSLNMFYSRYEKLLNLYLDILKESKPKDFFLRTLFIQKQIKHLFSNQKQIFDFLDQNNIELEENCD